MVHLVLILFELIVIGRVLSGWLGIDPNKPIVKAMHTVTEPVFALVKPLARKIPGPLDWTPAIVLVGVEILKQIF